MAAGQCLCERVKMNYSVFMLKEKATVWLAIVVFNSF